jgi:hypothetical protein
MAIQVQHDDKERRTCTFGGLSATFALEEANTIDGRCASARRTWKCQMASVDTIYGMASRSKYARYEGRNRARARDHRESRRQRARART